MLGLPCPSRQCPHPCSIHPLFSATAAQFWVSPALPRLQEPQREPSPQLFRESGVLRRSSGVRLHSRCSWLVAQLREPFPPLGEGAGGGPADARLTQVDTKALDILGQGVRGSRAAGRVLPLARAQAAPACRKRGRGRRHSPEGLSALQLGQRQRTASSPQGEPWLRDTRPGGSRSRRLGGTKVPPPEGGSRGRGVRTREGRSEGREVGAEACDTRGAASCGLLREVLQSASEGRAGATGPTPHARSFIKRLCRNPICTGPTTEALEKEPAAGTLGPA